MQPALRRALESQRAARLQYDRPLIAERFPNLEFYENIDPQSEGRFGYRGDLILSDDCGPPQPISIDMVFHLEYPRAEPRLYEIGGRFPHSADRHFYYDGVTGSRCCLWHCLESLWNPHDSNGLLVFMDHALVFFRRQLICDVTGKFPGAQRSHGAEGTREALAAYLGGEHLLEVFRKPLLLRGEFERNKPCPCGSARNYKKCHLPMLQLVRQRLSQTSLQLAYARVQGS